MNLSSGMPAIVLGILSIILGLVIILFPQILPTLVGLALIALGVVVIYSGLSGRRVT